MTFDPCSPTPNKQERMPGAKVVYYSSIVENIYKLGLLRGQLKNSL